MAEAATAAPPAPAGGKGASAAPAAQTTAPAKPPVEEATEVVKVNGKEVKLTKAQLVAAAQKGLFADQTLKSVDVLKKSTEGLLSQLKTPEGAIQVLKQLGMSTDDLIEKVMDLDVSDARKEKLAAWVYKNVVQPAKLSPEQVEQQKKLQRLEQLEKQEKDRQQKETQAQTQAQVQKIYQTLRTDVSKAILADKTFPQTEAAIKTVYAKLAPIAKQLVKGLPADAPVPLDMIAKYIPKAMELAKKDHLLAQQALFDAIEDKDGEGLIALIGEARALRISRALVARHKKKAETPAKPEEQKGESLAAQNQRRFGTNRHGYQVMDVL